MSLIGQVAQLWLRDVGSVNMLCRRWPNATAGLAITAGATPAFSAWTTIVAKSIISNPEWITGAFLEVPANAGANETWLVDIAQGAAGSELSLSSGTVTQQGIGVVSENWLSSVGAYGGVPFIPLFIPVKIIGAPRISGSLAGLVTGGKAAAMSFQSYSGIGT